jgi:hypothetical protein
VKTACFVADSPRLGRRKIRITGNASRQDMLEHLRAAYKEGAAEDYGAGFMMKPETDNCTEMAGEYFGLFLEQSNPHD